VTALTDLTPLIMPFVRDCSTPAAVVAARFAAIEFYKNTLWQQEQLEPMDLIEGQSTYELELQPDTVLSAVMRVEVRAPENPIDNTGWLGGWPLDFKTKDELDQMYGVRWTTLMGTPRFVTQFEPSDITLIPGPDAQSAGINVMRVLAAIQPTPTAMEIDDSVFNYYAEALAYGARARLVETAGQPYYDPGSAPGLWAKFYAGVSEAKARRMREHTRAVQSVQLRRWV
jgi:hypothetical protein